MRQVYDESDVCVSVSKEASDVQCVLSSVQFPRLCQEKRLYPRDDKLSSLSPGKV